jgi:hypothetical protein
MAIVYACSITGQKAYLHQSPPSSAATGGFEAHKIYNGDARHGGLDPCLLDASDTIIHGNRVPCPCSVLRLPRGFGWGLMLCIPGLSIPLLLLEANLGLS